MVMGSKAAVVLGLGLVLGLGGCRLADAVRVEDLKRAMEQVQQGRETGREIGEAAGLGTIGSEALGWVVGSIVGVIGLAGAAASRARRIGERTGWDEAVLESSRIAATRAR